MRCTQPVLPLKSIVPGGGTALVKAIANLENLSGENEDQNVGINIVRRAIQAPARQIADNAGADGAVIAGKLLEGRRIPKAITLDRCLRRPDQGWCHRPDQGCPLCLQNAASVAGLLITPKPWWVNCRNRSRQCPPGSLTWAVWAAWASASCNRNKKGRERSRPFLAINHRF